MLIVTKHVKRERDVLILELGKNLEGIYKPWCFKHLFINID
jgi:hypothetical protein